MTQIAMGRRLAPLLVPVLLVALARCTPTVTAPPSGGGGGGGGGHAAARLNITGQPSAIAVGQIISPPVRVVVADSNFLAVTTSNAPVTLSVIGSSTPPVVGIATRNAANGTAVMSGITIDSVGVYQFVATSPGLISDTSDQFVVSGVTNDTVTVEVGSDTATDERVFRSQRNRSVNPAVDTIPVGGAVHWLWKGNLTHGILINVPPVIYTSGDFTAPKELFLTINTAGNYDFICSVHGSLMSGRIVVR